MRYIEGNLSETSNCEYSKIPDFLFQTDNCKVSSSQLLVILISSLAMFLYIFLKYFFLMYNYIHHDEHRKVCLCALYERYLVLNVFILALKEMWSFYAK